MCSISLGHPKVWTLHAHILGPIEYLYLSIEVSNGKFNARFKDCKMVTALD